MRALVIAATIVAMAAAATPDVGRAQLPPAPDRHPGHRADQAGPASTTSVSLWEPRYTSFLLLSDTEDLVTLALDDDVLWLATEQQVTHLRGGVWEPPQLVSEEASIFALAPVPGSGETPGEVWAFGYEGGAWHRSGGVWSSVPLDTNADLYSAAARAPSDVWAVGFDYIDEIGTLAHYDGTTLTAFTLPWLHRQQLTTLSLDGSGELWAGGCRGNEGPFLMRDFGLGEWTEVDVPAVDGCIESLSFHPDGRGLAAAGGDVLWWDGLSWQALDVAPPEGSSWVRVAVTTETVGPGTADRTTGHQETAGDARLTGALRRSLPSAAADAPLRAPRRGRPQATGVPPTGYLVPGTPTWRGYIDGGNPWRFDGERAVELEVDYRGYDRLFVPGDENPDAQGFLGLVTDGTRTRSVSRSGGPAGLSRQAAVVSVEPSVARLSHPLMFTMRPTQGGRLGGGADIVAAGNGAVWAGASLSSAGPPGPAPFLRYQSDQWSVAPGSVFDEDDPFRIRAIDLATDDSGWALGRVDSDRTGQQSLAWRWDGTSWTEQPAPQRPIGVWNSQIRALPDGRAWALGDASELWSFDDESWAALSGAPRVGPVQTLRGEEELVPLRAPFDAVMAARQEVVGWAATREHFHGYSDALGWAEIGQSIPRGQVLDLQLVDETHGWAMGRDLDPGARESPAVLYVLRGIRWSEVDMIVPLRQIGRELSTWQEQPAQQAVDLMALEWQLMSAVDATNVWLYGTVPVADRPELISLLVHVQTRPGGIAVRATPYFGCAINALSARAVEGGTDVWIMGGSSCGPVAETVPRPYAGPVSVLRVRDVSSSAYLPVAANPIPSPP